MAKPRENHFIKHKSILSLKLDLFSHPSTNEHEDSMKIYSFCDVNRWLNVSQSRVSIFHKLDALVFFK